MKISRRPTILENFSILDVHYNSNFLGVDVKGRCSFIFGASYRHLTIITIDSKRLGYTYVPVGLVQLSYFFANMCYKYEKDCQLKKDLLMYFNMSCLV